jgi:hypothetical protein
MYPAFRFPRLRTATLIHADEAANRRERHQAAAQEQPEKNQRTLLEPPPGATLEQVEQAIAPHIKDDGHEREIQDRHGDPSAPEARLRPT